MERFKTVDPRFDPRFDPNFTPMFALSFSPNFTTDLFFLPGINVFDSLHIVFAIMESFRLTFDEYYPNFLLHSFPWFHFPIYRITLAGSIYMMIATAIGKLINTTVKS